MYSNYDYFTVSCNSDF